MILALDRLGNVIDMSIVTWQYGKDCNKDMQDMLQEYIRRNLHWKEHLNSLHIMQKYIRLGNIKEMQGVEWQKHSRQNTVLK